MGACGKRLGWGLRLPLLPPSALPPLQDSPERDGRPSWAGRGPSEVAAGAPLTPAEVGEDVVHPEPGSGCAHLGVAVAEAAAAACRVVGLQVKGPWAASEMEAGHAQVTRLGSGDPSCTSAGPDHWGYVKHVFQTYRRVAKPVHRVPQPLHPDATMGP